MITYIPKQVFTELSEQICGTSVRLRAGTPGAHELLERVPGELRVVNEPPRNGIGANLPQPGRLVPSDLPDDSWEISRRASP